MMKKILKKALSKMGYSVSRTVPRGFLALDAFESQKVLLNRFGVTAPIILDVGAHYGETIQAYKNIFPDSTIYAFEPFPASIDKLQEQFSGNAQIQIVPYAVSDRKGKTEYYVGYRDSHSSLLPRSKHGKKYFHPVRGITKEVIEVSTTTLDQWTAENSIRAIDILKLDIQGGELLAFQGAKNVLSNYNISVIYLEAYFTAHYEKSPLLNDLWSHLQDYSFSIYNIFNQVVAPDGQLRLADVIFVSSDLRHKVLACQVN